MSFLYQDETSPSATCTRWPLSSPCGSFVKREPLSSSLHPFKCSNTVMRCLVELSFLQCENTQLLPSSFTGQVVQPFDHIYGPPLDPIQSVHFFFEMRGPELDTVNDLQAQVHLQLLSLLLLLSPSDVAIHVQLFMRRSHKNWKRRWEFEKLFIWRSLESLQNLGNIRQAVHNPSESFDQLLLAVKWDFRVIFVMAAILISMCGIKRCIWTFVHSQPHIVSSETTLGCSW